MEVYAAMIDRMDQGIGTIVEELKLNGQFENTLILYLQDNGGCAEVMGRTGNDKHPDIPRPDSPTLPAMKPEEFAAYGSVPAQTRDGYPVRMGKHAMPGTADTYVAYGKGWANVSNTPFREYKHWVHEGGISTPLIAHWPRGIPESQRGSIVRTAGQLIDLMPTCVELGAAKHPQQFGGDASIPFEGVTLTPAFQGKPIERGKPLFWEHEGNRAVRDGQWKLVAKGPKGRWELYDIDADRVESRDLASENPERVQKMSSQWEQWANHAHVLPWPWDKSPAE
jgi:arylsulfatase